MPPKKVAAVKPLKKDPKTKTAKVTVNKGGSSSKPTKSKSSNKVASKTKMKKPKLTDEDKAAIKIQCSIRRFLARLKLKRIRKEKQDYEELIEKLQKEAWLEMIHRQREEEEKQRKAEEAERKRKAQEKKWIKMFLEAAFDGELQEIKSVLNEIEKNIRNNSNLTGDSLQRQIQRSKSRMIECEDANGNSALSEASAGGNVETISFLLENGAKINTVGSFHRTPLYRAAFGGHLDAVKFLLEEGGDPRILDNDGVTVEQVAAFPEISDFLRDWDVTKTETLLLKITEKEEKIKAEEMVHKKKEKEKIEKDIKYLENEYASKQKMLQKAHQELNKRIFEHDKAVGEGFERTDVTLQCIHDAEIDLSRAQKKEEETRKQLHEARLHLREQNSEETSEDKRVTKCNIKELDQVLMLDVGNILENCGKWPLLLDTSNQAVTFLRYRDTNYINLLNPKDGTEEVIRTALLGAIRYGKFLVVDMMEVDMMNVFEDQCNAIERNLYQLLMSKELLKDSKYFSLIRSTDGKEYEKQQFSEDRVSRFKFVVVTKMYEPPDFWLDQFYPIKIITPSME